jgi:hypothetical protein
MEKERNSFGDTIVQLEYCVGKYPRWRRENKKTHRTWYVLLDVLMVTSKLPVICTLYYTGSGTVTNDHDALLALALCVTVTAT